MLALTLLASRTTGDGEGPRYIGRVVSVSPIKICRSERELAERHLRWGSCRGDTPPRFGQCVGLFPGKLDTKAT
jgi:hypothetical protein